MPSIYRHGNFWHCCPGLADLAAELNFHAAEQMVGVSADVQQWLCAVARQQGSMASLLQSGPIFARSEHGDWGATYR